MYTEFYELKEKPFNLTPSPRFLYLSEGHKEALALLKYGVMDRKGFILLTGEVGTGKTTMVRTLLDDLNHTVKYVLLSNPIMSPNDFINYLALTVFKKKIHFHSKAHFLLVFEPYLKRALNNHENFNLIIDEAHKLSFELLEEIRLLSNMETGDDKLINIFLVGQPELNEKLSDPKCRPLLQRISIRHHIHPLKLEETREYMATRMKVAGVEKENKIFSKKAVEAIYDLSKGYPREINILADNALLLGYSRGTRKISPSMVKECYEDIQLHTSTRERSIRETENRGTRERETEKRRNPSEIGAKGAPVEYATHSTGQAFHGASGQTGKLANGERESEVEPVESDIEQVETHQSSRIWKWAAVLFFFISLSMLALSPSGEKAVSHLTASISSTYQEVLETLIGKPVTATNGIRQVVPNIPERNRSGLPMAPSSEIVDKRTDRIQPELVPTEIMPEKKTKAIEKREASISKIEDSKTTGLANNASEQPIEAKTLVQEKKKEPNRIIIVGRGDTLSGLTRKIYGTTSDEIITMVKAANPDLKNIHFLKPGQKIILPPLTEFEKNKAFTVHVASYKLYEPALSTYRDLLENGHEAYILPKEDPQKGRIFRVTVGYFKSQSEAKNYAATIIKQGTSTYANPIEVEVKSEVRGQSLRSQRSE